MKHKRPVKSPAWFHLALCALAAACGDGEELAANGGESCVKGASPFAAAKGSAGSGRSIKDTTWVR